MGKELTERQNKTGRGGVEKNSGPHRELNPNSPVAHFLT
jgi:hypothetical protein